MKICHGGPGYKEDERMHWLSKKRYKIGLVIPTLVVYMVFIIIPIGMSIGYSFYKIFWNWKGYIQRIDKLYEII